MQKLQVPAFPALAPTCPNPSYRKLARLGSSKMFVHLLQKRLTVDRNAALNPLTSHSPNRCVQLSQKNPIQIENPLKQLSN